MRTTAAILFGFAAASNLLRHAAVTGLLVGLGVLCLCAALDAIVRNALLDKADPWKIRPDQRARFKRFNGDATP